jgi:hypothetical protein
MPFYRSETAEMIREEWLQQGRARREAELILRAMTVRGIEFDDAVRDKVLGCADLDSLDRWFDRARTVTRAEDIFAGG